MDGRSVLIGYPVMYAWLLTRAATIAHALTEIWIFWKERRQIEANV